MGRKRKQRRQPHGSAWFWQQTGCWYYTLPGTKKRMPLFDDHGQRLRGRENREQAELALARVKLTQELESGETPVTPEGWLVARVCSLYLQYCERGLARGTLSQGHRDNAVSFLNDLCRSCGALPVPQFHKGHLQTWLDSHPRWRSPATRRSVLAIVLAAFNYAQHRYGLAHALKGLKKPPAQPRLSSFCAAEEEALYQATEEHFRDFLFAAIHSGLRPFCELARLTAEDVEETARGMMWRVASSKTKKTRKIPVRPELAELTRPLLKTAPAGSGLPLFRNTRGQPWKRMTGVVRFLALKKKLGWDQDPVRKKYSCYTCRHTFAHRMLSGYWNGGRGCSIETLAELLGDTPKVAFDHYGKEWGQHYQDPLWAALGSGWQGAAEERDGGRSAASRAASQPAAPQGPSLPEDGPRPQGGRGKPPPRPGASSL